MKIDSAAFVHITEDGVKLKSVDKPSELWYRQVVKLARLKKEHGLYPANPGWYCKYCEVKPECPVWFPEKEPEVVELLERSYTE